MVEYNNHSTNAHGGKGMIGWKQAEAGDLAEALQPEQTANMTATEGSIAGGRGWKELQGSLDFGFAQDLGEPLPQIPLNCDPHENSIR